ncbi:acetyltransferase [Paenibacillus athensensis]|nr:acetyltransferase [Paenibacillus athensensis]
MTLGSSSSQQRADERYVFQTTHPALGQTIAFRPVSLEDDFERLYAWHQEPHVIPYWKLNISREKYREHLEAFLADQHQTLYIGCLDGEPMSYFEAYWAKDDLLGRYYEADAHDQGVHLLIGPPEFLGRGLALPLLQALTRFLLLHEPTARIVAEPDVRNAKMRHIFRKCGFDFVQEVVLPDKTAALMIGQRGDLERGWQHG